MSNCYEDNDGDVVAEIKKCGRPMSAAELCQNPAYGDNFSPEELSEFLWVLATEGRLAPHKMSSNKCNDKFVAR